MSTDYIYKSVLRKMGNNIENIIPKISTYRNEIILGVCALIFAYIITALIKKARSNFPPGPMGLPIVGYLPFISENMHLDFMKLGNQYGDVFSVKLGSQKFVVLHGTEVIREAFNKPEFLGRPPFGPLKEVLPNSPFFSSDFHAWNEHRRFVVQSMKELGLGKTRIEEDVMDEVNSFLMALKSHNGQPTDVKMPLSSSMSNIICALIFGKRYDYDNPNRQLLDKNLDKMIVFMSHIPMDFLFPWTKYIPFVFKKLDISISIAAVQNIFTFFRQEIDAHKKTLDRGHVRDFVDAYLLEIEAHKENDPQTPFHYDMMLGTVFDIFVAGSETVRTSTLWLIYCIAAFPDIQKKVYDETLEVLGSDRNPEFQDLKDMPYTHAVILELMRWKTINPLSLLHYTLADSTAGGYDIPKDTLVMANFWNVHHNPRYWKEPDDFKPEHFLSKDGKSIVKSSNYMPFFLGKRACPGENMAYMEVFLYLTSILQKFELAFPPGQKVDFAAKVSLAFRLEPFLVRFLPRN